MSWVGPDIIHRTAKQLVDAGRAASPEQATAMLEGLVLQVDAAAGLGNSPAGQAALLTAVNAGHRAFLGGVVVRVEEDPTLTVPWAAGLSLSTAIERFGGRVVETLGPTHPTLVIGRPARDSAGTIVLRATWSGWCGGVVEADDGRLSDEGIALAGVVAGALGVSEVFQHALGSPMAGRRDVGISLWRPDRAWRDPDAVGPALGYLPDSLWLLGLGHLGQGYGWSLGMLPYATPEHVTAYLVDFDVVQDGNLATGMLLTRDDRGQRKTRVVARQLEEIGLRTALVERRFDDSLHPDDFEPRLALAGFDHPEPRQALGGGKFTRVVDGGLGAGPVEYLDIVVHTFPSPLDPKTEFAVTDTKSLALPAAYEDAIERLVDDGVPDGEARCGMLDIAGVTVAAAFVGAVAGALVVSDPLRLLHGGAEFSVIAVDLRSPHDVRAVQNTAPSGDLNPGATAAR